MDILLTRPAALDLRTWAREQARDLLPGVSDDELSMLAQVVASAAQGSPRVVKRILNGVGARYALLSGDARSGVALSQIALVEAVVSRYPVLIDSVSGNPDGFVRMRDNLRQAMDTASRARVVAEYLASCDVDDEKGRISASLRDFLLRNDTVNLTADTLQSVLALREDRRWRGVTGSPEIKRALATGEEDAFASAYRELDEVEQTRAREAAMDEIRSSYQYGFYEDATRALNSVVPSMADSVGRSERQALAQELALHIDIASLDPATVDLVFDGSTTTRSAGLIAKAVDTVGEQEHGKPSASSIRALASSVALLSDADRAVVRKGLADVGDELLAPLFEPGDHVALLTGGVTVNYIKRLAEWDPAEEDSTGTATAANRLGWLRTQVRLRDDVFEPVATRVSGVLPSTSADDLTVLQAIVGVLGQNAEPSPGVDTTAQQLSAWSAAQGAGLMMAWRLPMTAATLSTVRSRTEPWLASAAREEVSALLEQHRGKLKDAGVPVGTLLANRWAAGEGVDFAEFVISGQEADWIDQLIRVVEAAPSASVLPRLCSEAAALLQVAGLDDALAALATMLSTRVASMPVTDLSGAVDAMGSLQQAGVDVTGPVAALDTRVSATATGELPAVADAVGRALDARIPGAAKLPGRMISRSAALGQLDLGTAIALGRHSSTSIGDLRRALAAAIRDPTVPVGKLRPVVEGLRGKLRGDWHVSAAAVARAGTTPSESAELLGMLTDWKPPPASAPEYEEFGDQLTRLAESDASLEEMVKHLRD